MENLLNFIFAFHFVNINLIFGRSDSEKFKGMCDNSLIILTG